MTSQKEKRPASPVWQLFISVKLTVGLLIFLAVTSAAGTIIPQTGSPEQYIEMYGSFRYALIRDPTLMPALKSNWLIAHVVICFIGYAAFAIAFGIGIMFLAAPSDTPSDSGLLSRLSEKSVMDELMHKMVTFGFLFLTADIITGAVWANSAWEKY